MSSLGTNFISKLRPTETLDKIGGFIELRKKVGLSLFELSPMENYGYIDTFYILGLMVLINISYAGVYTLSHSYCT